MLRMKHIKSTFVCPLYHRKAGRIKMDGDIVREGVGRKNENLSENEENSNVSNFQATETAHSSITNSRDFRSSNAEVGLELGKVFPP